MAGSTGGGSGSTGSGAGSPAPRAQDRFAVGEPGSTGTVQLGAGAVGFATFEWAVPALVLTVPGLLLVLAVAAEAMIGLAWIPLARRWVGEDDHRRRRRRRPAAA